jgi:hypothetical protein
MYAVCLITTLVLCSAFAAAPAFAQELPGGGPSPLLYLHPLANYAPDPEWTRDWERTLQKANSLRVNVGSVSTDDFLTDVELHVTEPVSSRFRALYDLKWLDGLHVETRDTEHFLGFEFAVHRNLGLQGQAHPASRKEELDLRFGLLVHDGSREQYARVFVRWDDPLFDDKNGVGGTGEQTATSLEWVVRATAGPFELFSEGLYGSSGRRSYPDSTRVPDRLADSGRLDGSRTRARYLFGEPGFVELGLDHHRAESSVTPRATATALDYENELLDVALRGVWHLDPSWRARAEVHRLVQAARSTSFDYDRSEWMPGAWVRWSAGAVHHVEVGYMGTGYEWDGSPDSPRSESGYKQKLELAWLIEPSPDARVQLSLSHEPDPQRFGGGNVQVQLHF